MEWRLGIVVLCLFVCLSEQAGSGDGRLKRPPLNGYKFRIIPHVFHSSLPNLRLITTLSSKGVYHLPHITWRLKKQTGHVVNVDLNLTKINWNDNFVIHMTNDRNYTPTLGEKLQHHCTYQGRIREHPELTAYLSTCWGLEGYLSLGNGKVLNVRPLNKLPFDSFKPLQAIHTTYYLSNGKMVGEKAIKKIKSEGSDVLTPTRPPLLYKNARSKRMAVKKVMRSKRWYGEIERQKENRALIAHGADENTRYVELFVVADHSIYKKYGDFWNLVARIKQIIQIANAHMRQVNFFLVFTGLEVWDRENEVPIPETEAFEILLFKNHTQQLVFKHKFDIVLYLVGNTFSNLFGQSFSGRMCSNSYAYILVADVSAYPIFAASTLAHALAHTVNVSHDALHCKCSVDPLPCIMNEVTDNTNARTKWSECSLKTMKTYIADGGGYCLMDRPVATLFGSTCGDGLIEKEEECDCGLLEYGSCAFSRCCDPVTCKLKPHAICSAGECCNTTSCQYFSKSKICRQLQSDSCDIGETCTGVSALCPEDLYTKNGEACIVAGREAFCYNGKCENHESQCQKLYGEHASVADDRCYTFQNLEGQPGGSCDSRSIDQFYPPCELEHVWCGTLHCTHPTMTPSQTPKFMGGLHTLWTNYNNRTAQHKSFGCKWVVYDVGVDQRDPGLVQNGVRCNPDAMCIDSMCRKIKDLKFPECPKCLNGGKCTNLGSCDCGPNYLPPICKEKNPLYSYRKTKMNLGMDTNNRNILVGSIAGLLLMLAVMFVLAIAIRKCVYKRNVQNEFKSLTNPVRKLSNKTHNNMSQSCNGDAVKNNKLSPFSSPQHGRKDGKNKLMTKIPTLRIYDISGPLLQSSTNNHLTELTAKDSISTADSSSTTEEQNPPYITTTKTFNSPQKVVSTEETIYANDIMVPTLNDILNNKTRLMNKHKKDEQDENSTDQSTAEEERPLTPKLKYENVGDVKVQKEEADKVVDKCNKVETNQKVDKVVYANSMCLPQAPLMQTSQVVPAARYDNIDDLISVRCPLYQPIIKATNKLSSFEKPEDCLYATPLGKKKNIYKAKGKIANQSSEK